MEHTAFVWHTASLRLLLFLLLFLMINVKLHKDILLFLNFALVRLLYV